MKGEIWKDIEGYEGLYQISNMGRVKSLNYNHTGKEGILRADKNNMGYLQVYLYKDGKGKHYTIHRLVATAFCENQMGYTEVNHINEDKSDNRAENLEWCNRLYNCNYGTRNNRVAEKMRGKKQSEEHIKKRSKPIYSINKVSGLIMYWTSAKEAGNVLDIPPTNITKCCKGKLKSAGGFTWYYADADIEE